MFADHGTFIVGISIAKQHLNIAPERAAIIHFSEEIGKVGYDHSKELLQIRWDSPIDFKLLEKMIAFNILEKADYSTFWRK